MCCRHPTTRTTCAVGSLQMRRQRRAHGVHGLVEGRGAPRRKGGPWPAWEDGGRGAPLSHTSGGTTPLRWEALCASRGYTPYKEDTLAREGTLRTAEEADS